MKNSCKLFLFILGLWLGLTCFLDFFAVPTIFRTLPSRELAGKLGMIFFYTFNKLELVFVLALAICAWFFRHEIKWKKTFWSSISSLFILIMIYLFHMTPTIIEVNKAKYQLMEGSPEYEVLEQKHLFYHGLFRKTDGAKILVLLVLLGSTLRKRREEV